MKPVLILVFKEMKKKFLYTLTLILITTVSMLVCLFAVTDSGGFMFQEKSLKAHCIILLRIFSDFNTILPRKRRSLLKRRQFFVQHSVI